MSHMVITIMIIGCNNDDMFVYIWSSNWWATKNKAYPYIYSLVNKNCKTTTFLYNNFPSFQVLFAIVKTLTQKIYYFCFFVSLNPILKEPYSQ